MHTSWGAPGESCLRNRARRRPIPREHPDLRHPGDATTQINPCVYDNDSPVIGDHRVEIVNSPTVPTVEQVAASHCSTCCRLTTRSTLLQTGGVSLIIDQTGLYNRLMARAQVHDRGWVSSVRQTIARVPAPPVPFTTWAALRMPRPSTTCSASLARGHQRPRQRCGQWAEHSYAGTPISTLLYLRSHRQKSDAARYWTSCHERHSQSQQQGRA